MAIANFTTGLSGLQSSQRALEIIGENIANANTPGFHRQVAQLTERTPTNVAGFAIGSGVDVATIARLRSSLLESAITQQTADTSDTTAQLDTLRQVESLLSPGDGSLDNLMAAFFNQVDQLSSQPDDTAQRRVLLGGASALTSEFNSLSNAFGQIHDGLGAQIQQVVDDVNTRVDQIAELNGEIQRSEVRGISANDQRDQRDQLINELAQRVGVQAIEQDSGQTNVLVAGLPVVLGTQATRLQVNYDNSGNATISAAGSSAALTVTGGQLGGLLQVRNQAVPDFQSRLDTLAKELARGLDEIQATGLGLNGPVRFLSGERGVSDIGVPLAQAGLAFPPKAGSLFISVTEQATGKRTLTEVAIDPATQSLQDVANAISAVPNIQAVVDAQTGTLQILAQPGYAFDFAGRLPTSPDTVNITGTTTPQIAGSYTGTANDTYTFKVVGTGTVGVTSNLTLEVRNAAGALVNSLNVGQGYAPNSSLQVANGVTVSLASGQTNDGDNFSIRVVGQPDSAGLLAALGLKTFFTGSNASDLHVNAALLAKPDQLAAARSDQPGDGSNLNRLAALRDTPLLAGGTQNYGQFHAAMVGDIGIQVQALDQQQTTQQALGQNLQAQQQSVSGVDPNEELVNMLQFQRAFQISSQYIRAVNSSMDDLLTLVQ